MYKYCVSLYSGLMMGVMVLGIVISSYYVQILINTTTPFMLVRLLIVLCLMAYVFFPKIRNQLARAFIALFGITLITFSIITLVSPTFLGHFNYFLPIGDVLGFLEGGILASLVSIELPSKKSQLMARSLAYSNFLVMSFYKKVLQDLTTGQKRLGYKQS